MNILVINVVLRENAPALFPVGLGYVCTAMNEAGYDFDLLDMDLYKLGDDDVVAALSKKKYDVVCIGTLVTGYSIVKKLTALVRREAPQVKIMVGNSVATSIPETLLTRTETDIAVIGEGEITVVELLDAIKEGKDWRSTKGIAYLADGKLILTEKRPLIKDVNSLPFLNYDLFDVMGFINETKETISEPLPMPREEIRALPVNSARGCVANCTFCYHVFKGSPYRHRSVESIVSEIQSLKEKYGLNYVRFWDELTFFSKKYTLAMADAMIGADLNVYWVANCRATLFDSEDDLEILTKLKQAGCIGLGYSLENADPDILKAMNKHITPEQFLTQTRLLKKAGLVPWTSLVLGYPQETCESIKKTFDCCIKGGVSPSVGYLLPQPGSVMYDYARENGFIPDEEEYLLAMGDRQDLRLNMTSLGDEEFVNCVEENTIRCSRELGLHVPEENPLKTMFYRSEETCRDS